MIEVGVFDLSYYVARGEEKHLESFAKKYLSLITHGLLFDICAEALYEVCKKIEAICPGEAARFFLANSNLIRALFYKFVISRLVTKVEYVDFGKIIDNLPFDNPHWGPTNEKLERLSKTLYKELHSERFSLIKILIENFKKSVDQEVLKKSSAIKFFVYFVKTKQKELYEKFYFSLTESGFDKKEAGLIIKSVKNFFSGKE